MSRQQNDLLLTTTIETTTNEIKGKCYKSNNLVRMILTLGATFWVTINVLQYPMFVNCETKTITNRSNNLTEQINIVTNNNISTNIDNINNGSSTSSRNSSPNTNTSSSNSSNNVTNNEKQIPLVRLPSNTLLKYTAYKDVSILHFRIPVDTQTALFSFKAYEESKSAFSEYYFLIFSQQIFRFYYVTIIH